MFPPTYSTLRPGDPPCPPAPPDPPLRKPSDWSEPADFPTQKASNNHNNWIKNTRVKTGKCDICSERIKIYSWECEECRKRICSECAEYGYGSSQPQYRFIARDNLFYKCGCYYADTGGQAPYVLRQMEALGIVRPPPWRGAEDMRNRQVKADIKERKRKREEATAKGDNAEVEVKTLKAAQEARLKESRFNAKACKAKRGRPPRKITKRVPPFQHLQNGTTVIVGAGIVGMCIAYELATKLKVARIQHNVIVIDMETSYCGLASANCAGLVTARGLPEEMGQLVELAKQAWQELFNFSTFGRQTHFNVDKVFSTYKEEGRKAVNYPSWFVPDNEIFLEEEDSMATIDTVLFGQWLHNQCTALGVRFHFRSHLTSVSKLPSVNDVSAVELRTQTHDGETTASRIECSNLVLACGPWTTKLFSSIFKKSPLQLDNHVRKAYHYRVIYNRMPESEHTDIGVFLPDLVAENDALEPQVFVAGRPWRPTVTLGFLGKSSINRPCLRAEAKHPPAAEERGVLEQVERITETKVIHNHHHSSHDVGLNVANTASGISLVSAAQENGLPIIDKVPASALGRILESDAEDKRTCGIWLCYGFGMHGTSLGPAAARLLVRKMMGVETQVEERHFAIPAYVKPVKVAEEGRAVGEAGVVQKTEDMVEVMDREKEKANDEIQTGKEKPGDEAEMKKVVGREDAGETVSA